MKVKGKGLKLKKLKITKRLRNPQTVLASSSCSRPSKIKRTVTITKMLPILTLTWIYLLQQGLIQTT